MGVARTDPRYVGHNYGHLAAWLLAEKIEEEFNVEPFFQINIKTNKSTKDLKQFNAELIDTFCWISVKLKTKATIHPAWGHL